MNRFFKQSSRARGLLSWLLTPILTACLAAVSLRATEPSITSMAAGKKLYQNRCAKCHRMYDPAKYSDAQWQSWMDKMAKKAKLQPEEKQKLLEYVEQTLRAPATRSGKPSAAR